MNNRLLVTLTLLTTATMANAQSGSEGSLDTYLKYGLIGIVLVAVLFGVITVLFSLVDVGAKDLEVEAPASGVSKGFSFFKPSVPNFVDGPVHFFKKGHDILLEGAAEGAIQPNRALRYAVQPGNFRVLSPIPKVEVNVGDSVKAGDVLFYDKNWPELKFVAPVSGEIIAVERGDKRAIKQVIILGDREVQYKSFQAPSLERGNREELVAFLLSSGAWAHLRQRPFDVTPDPNAVPSNIFISTFDSAPLAPDLNVVVSGREAAFQKGIDVLARLTSGKVHLGLNARSKDAPNAAFLKAENCVKHWFHGKHPAGNVGVQIHHVSPVSLDHMAWAVGVQDVITLGTLFTEGKYNASRVVAVTGAELNKPAYVQTYLGASLEDLLKDQVQGDHKVRIISGDVLSGEAKGSQDFLNFFDDQVTVVKEGDYYEMFGWLVPLKARPSVSRTFPNFLFPGKKFEADTNTHGEKRAFVVTGQYEDVLPMDIYPQHLMRAILFSDFEQMEGLGIYELVEEDVALCEFTCTSKQPLQQILRQGLETMREQA